MTRRLLMAARSGIPHRAAGYQRIAWDLGAALHRRGWDVTLLTSPVPGRAKEFGEDGLQVVTVPDSWPERAELGTRAWEREAPVVARRLGLDSYDALLGTGLSARPLRRRPRPRQGGDAGAVAPSVLLYRDMLLDEGPRRTFPSLRPRNLGRIARELDCLRRADRVIVPDAGARDALRQWPYRWTRGARHVEIATCGVPTRRFHPDRDAGAAWRAANGIAAKAPLVVTVAHLEAGKGMARAVRAFHGFRRAYPDARYAVIGAGPRLGRLRDQADRLSLGERILLLGRLPDLHVVRWLQAADLFLFLPRTCDVRPPRNVLEALACGVPVVASPVAIAARAGVGTPHPLLHSAPYGRAADAVLVMSEVWEARDGRGKPPPLPPAWTIESSAQRHDAVLQEARGAPEARGRRA